MRGTKPRTQIPQVSHQRHINFPLFTQTLPKSKPTFGGHGNRTRGIEEERGRKRKRNREGSSVKARALKRVWGEPEPEAKNWGHKAESPIRLPSLLDYLPEYGPHGLININEYRNRFRWVFVYLKISQNNAYF